MNAIREHRTQRKWTQAELAERLGVERSTVAKWESGASQPQAAHLIALAEIFECTVDALLKRERK
ncbi:MAG: helix-turn-helix transcriptional regulator [Schwartzia sp.]|nr:helix-turn-helix transcriptional regulator [Schwartzia sp. (in: firmicutes)]